MTFSLRRVFHPYAIRGMAALAVGLTVATCRDNPVAPRRGGPASIAVRPVVPAHIDLSGFGLTIDSLRVVVVRAPADTLRDTTAFFSPDSNQVHLGISLLLAEPAETLSVSLMLSAGGVPLYSGTQKALVTVGASALTAPPISIVLTFSGPGAGVTALHVTPLDSVLHFSDSLRFRVTADSAGIPVNSFYTAWHTSDTLAARINAFGILHAPALRKSVYVIVRTPSGASDSTPVTFIPTPTQLTVQGGGNQSGPVAAALPQPLRVQITAADGLGVKGIPVQFSVVSGGGSITPATLAVTDTGGFASAVATLGTVTGAASFQAASAGLTAVTFAEIGTAGTPTQVLVNAGTGQSAVVRTALPVAPSVVVKDTFNNVVPGVVVAFSVNPGMGQVTQASDTTNGSGVATVGSWTLDSVARTDTLTATVGTRVRVFTATALPGAVAPATSVTTPALDTVASGTAKLLTLHGHDQFDNVVTTGGATVVFSIAGGGGTGQFSTVTDHGDGTYTATFTGLVAGTDTIKTTVNGTAAATAKPLVLVIPGAASLAKSVITVSDSVVPAAGIDTLKLSAHDSVGNALIQGGLTVVFSVAGGNSIGTIGPTTDLGNGAYRAIFTGVSGGTALQVGATIGGSPVTSAPVPTVRVNTTAHIANILADSVWTLAGSPHLVHGYLKIANGATLTIQPGAVVKFDTGSGLQVGDSAAAQTGGLSLAGTALQPIALTADSTGVRPGFWKGIEVQRLLAPASWSHVLIEGAGGARGATGAESCLLKLGATALTVDSLHVRACLHSGIKLWGGALTVRRSEIDSVPEDGLQVVNTGALTLDTTVIRGSGFHGLTLGSGTVLAQASRNRFIANGAGNLSPAVDLQALHLAHFGLQDSIAGNALNLVQVEGGRPDTGVSAFTVFRQGPAAPYLINGTLAVGSGAGQTLTLDSNVILEFKPQAALLVGDTLTGRKGALKSLATGSGNGALLTSAQASPAPGDWVGLEFGPLVGPDTLTGLHVQFAGDSVPGHTLHRAGIWVRNSDANELVIQGAALAANGSAAAISNAYGLLVTGSGGGVHVYGSITTNTAGSAYAYSTPGVRLVGDTALASTLMGLADFIPSGTNLSSADSIAQSRFAGGLYPALVPVGVLPGFYATNSWNGNVRDTLLMGGGAVLGQAVTFPRVHAVPWRFLGQVTVAAGGSVSFAAGDTVTFDSSTAIVVGDSLNGSGTLTAIGSDTAPILFTATPGFGYWHGITYIETAGDTSLRHVTVDGAGYFLPCPIIDCNGQPIGAIYVVGTLTNNLVFDSITVRHSVYYAVEAQQGGSPGTVVVNHSQFYANNYTTLLLASRGQALSVDSSDIYHYRISGNDLAILNASGSADSVTATGNWWGDVSGPGTVAFGSPDSLGRTLLDTVQYGVTFRPFVTAPYFPVGGIANMTPAADSVVFCCNVQAGLPLPDSIRIRALDFVGRGVGGLNISWNPAPGSGLVLAGGTTDAGGRAGALWTPATLAKLDTATATFGGSVSAHLYVNVFAGPLLTEHWQYLPGLTEGTLLSPDTAVFTASGHVGAVITNAVDAFGNAVQAQNLYFDTIPGPGFARAYGIITKLAADTIFFVDTSSLQAPFQIHGVYQGPVGQVNDSVVIISSFVPVGVRFVSDTVTFNALCPTGPGNVFCSRAVTAQLFDSSGAALPPNGQIFFSNWTSTGPITVDSTGGLSGMTAFITARNNGPGTLSVSQLTGPPLTPATASTVVLARQVTGQMGVTPDTLSTGIGDTVSFHALAADSGGTPLVAQPAIQWQITPQFPGLVKLDSAADSLDVRLDSGVYNFSTFNWVGVVRPFTERTPGDTVFGQSTLFNPIHYELPSGTGSSEGGSLGLVDTVVNKAFYSDPGSNIVHVNQLVNNNAFDIINVGSNPRWLAVSHAGGVDKLYVSNGGDGTVSVVDPVNEITTATIPLQLGFAPFGVAAADPLGRVYVAATFCSPFNGICTGVYIVPIDISGDSVVNADIFRLGTDSSRFPQGMAYNRNDGLLYVAMDSGYVKVENPVTKTEVATIMVDPGFTLPDVAVNNVTDTVYVADSRGNIGVIDAATGTLVNTLPANTPNGLAVDEVRNRIYYASTGNESVIEIDGNNENYHTLLVGTPGNSPTGTLVDPKSGTVFAPHGSGLAILQFFGPPVGFLQFAPAPPFRLTRATTAVRSTAAPLKLAPMAQPPALPTARPASPAGKRPANAASDKKRPPQ